MLKWRKMKNNLFFISNNGFRYIFYAFLASIVFSLLDLDTLAFVSFIVIFMIAYAFRNPEREVTIFDEGNAVSPVDGKIVAIEELHESEYAYKVIVQSNYLDIGILRAPYNSSISGVSKKNGARLSLKSALSRDVNAHVEVVFSYGEFNQIKVKHVLTQSFAPLHINIFQNQSIRQSTRYGFMLNGFTEIYIPKNFRLNVHNGKKVTASESLLGFFIAIP